MLYLGPYVYEGSIRYLAYLYPPWVTSWGGLEDVVCVCNGAHVGVADSDSSGGDRHTMLPLDATIRGQ